MKWEYDVVSWKGAILDNENEELAELLNAYGNEGWELVNIIPQVGTSFSQQTITSSNHLIFKRSK